MSVEPLPVVRAADLVQIDPTRRWLVDGLWSRAAVGIIGGAPKCKKSWLGLDLAISVASGTPCLGAFDVLEPGPALLYMAEDDASTVKARAVTAASRSTSSTSTSSPRRACASIARSIDDASPPSWPSSRRASSCSTLRTAAPPRRERRRPHLRPATYLRELQREHNLAVVVVHHARKNGGASSSGQNLRGSGDFHAWVDSSLYLRKRRELLLLAVEHRAAPAIDPVALDLVGDEGELHLEVAGTEQDSDDADDLASVLLAALDERPRTRTDLRAHLRVRNERLGVTLAQLRDAGRILQRDGLWVVVPRSAP